MYPFRCDFSSCSECTEIWHADSFCVKNCCSCAFHKLQTCSWKSTTKSPPPPPPTPFHVQILCMVPASVGCDCPAKCRTVLNFQQFSWDNPLIRARNWKQILLHLPSGDDIRVKSGHNFANCHGSFSCKSCYVGCICEHIGRSVEPCWCRALLIQFYNWDKMSRRV